MYSERFNRGNTYNFDLTKSGRFRAYLYFVGGMKDFKRARELLFFKLYRKVKKLQKGEKLYSFNGRNLTEWLWGISPPIRRERKETCKIIKAPAFLRKLREMELDAFELWKRAVITLFSRHDSYRYVRVIQPVGRPRKTR